MKIIIETVPKSALRYSTVGDWFYNDKEKCWYIQVAEFAEKKGEYFSYEEHFEYLIAIHELVEMFLCQSEMIDQKTVDKFDMETGKNSPEPGDESDSPYYEQHQIASAIETLLVEATGITIGSYHVAVDEKSDEIDKFFGEIKPVTGGEPEKNE